MNQKEKAKFRATPLWKAFRQHLLKTRGKRCEVCNMPHVSRDLQVHHHDPDHYTDLQPHKFTILCNSCHVELERLLSMTKHKLDIDKYSSKMRSTYLKSIGVYEDTEQDTNKQ